MTSSWELLKSQMLTHITTRFSLYTRIFYSDKRSYANFEIGG